MPLANKCAILRVAHAAGVPELFGRFAHVDDHQATHAWDRYALKREAKMILCLHALV